MAERIRQAVSYTLPLIRGRTYRDELHGLIAEFAQANLYARPAAVADRLQKRIVHLLAKKWFPAARKAGAQSAKPIIEALKGRKITERGLRLRGTVLRRLDRYSRLNLRAFEAAVRGEVGQLSPQLSAEFLRAQRDGKSRQQLIRDMLKADRDELKSLGEGYKRLDAAEDGLAKARTPEQVKAARRERRLARASVRGRKSFLARLETRVQADARDAIRREAQEAQQATFEQAGYKVLQWIAVNGGDACPSCAALHGTRKPTAQWRGTGPGAANTYCGSSCMCVLVPAEYVTGRPGLEKPIRL